MTDPGERLITPRFVLVVTAGLAYFFSLGMLLPVVPLYVEGPLRGSDLAVGVVVGAFSVGAIVVRPWAGRIGDRFGRRLLIIGGALVVALSAAMYHFAHDTTVLTAVRVLGGVGEAAFFVGAGTMVTDLAPEARRGEAISYWSVAVYGGMALGPALGETLACSGTGKSCRGGDFALVWWVSAGLALLAAAVGTFTRETAPARAGTPEPVAPRPRLLHPAAVLPGTVLFLGMVGLAGFASFVALYAREIGMTDSRGVLALYAIVILAVRVLGAKVPDRIGPVRAASIATATGAVGLVVIAAIPHPAGLVAGTVVFAVGMSMLYPSMLMLALADLPASERGSAVGTVSSFFDLSQGAGAAILGGIASFSGYRGAFVGAAVFALAALTLLRWDATRRSQRAAASVPV